MFTSKSHIDHFNKLWQKRQHSVTSGTAVIIFSNIKERLVDDTKVEDN